MFGPQIWLCLFTFRPIETSKQLNGLTTINTFSWRGGAVVTQEVPSSITGSRKGFYVWFVVLLLLGFYVFCPKTQYLSQKFAIHFTILIYLVYLTYCKICDRLLGYKDTDQASLNWKRRKQLYIVDLHNYTCTSKIHIYITISQSKITRYTQYMYKCR